MWRHRRVRDDVDGNIRDRLERETARNVGRGMTSAAARDAAQRAFDSAGVAKEHSRDVWVPKWIDEALQDARYALRLWRRAPAFSVLVAGGGGVGGVLPPPPFPGG